MFFCVEQGGERKEQRMKVATTIRLPEELKKELENEAQAHGYTLGEQITIILWRYFETTAQE